MNILFLSLLCPATGNATTANRIASYLEADSHTVILKDQTTISDGNAVRSLIKKHSIDVVIGIHAFGSGRLLIDLPVPTIIIFSGSDLNVVIEDDEKRMLIDAAVTSATALIAFDSVFLKKASALWSDALSKMHCIPQAVQTSPSSYSLKNNLDLSDDDHLFLLPAGIRDIKDPLFLVEEIQKWHKEDSSIHLAIIGNVLDEKLASEITLSAYAGSGIHLCSVLDQEDLHSVMQEATAVLNTSKSEGMCGALLEAMDLEVPVIARDISGNRNIIAHLETGLLFDNPHQFRTLAQSIIDNVALRDKLIQSAKDAITRDHNPETEAEAYRNLLSEIY